MGYELVEEVMDYAPASLKPMEWKGLIVLARDANDRTRLTFHGVNDAEILHRVGVSKSRWDNIRGGLLAAGVLEYARRADGTQARGNAGGSAKFRIPDLTRHPEAREKPAGNQQPSEKAAETQQPSDGESMPETSNLLDEKVAGNQQKRLPETSTPTPLTPPGTTSSLPQQRSVDEIPEGREGGEQQNSKAFQALAAIVAKEPKLALGVDEIKQCESTVALWLERSSASHLEMALTRGLPDHVGHPLGLVRKRLLGKLPPEPARRVDGGRECSECHHVRPVVLSLGSLAYCESCSGTCSKCDRHLPDAKLLDGLCALCRNS